MMTAIFSFFAGISIILSVFYVVKSRRDGSDASTDRSIIASAASTFFIFMTIFSIAN